jgi:hypothetical protein
MKPLIPQHIYSTIMFIMDTILLLGHEAPDTSTYLFYNNVYKGHLILLLGHEAPDTSTYLFYNNVYKGHNPITGA